MPGSRDKQQKGAGAARKALSECGFKLQTGGGSDVRCCSNGGLRATGLSTAVSRFSFFPTLSAPAHTAHPPNTLFHHF